MNTQDSIRIQSQKDPAQLEREIDRQRDHIGDIVHALENKLSPGEVFERILGYGRSGGREFATNLSQTVKANPVPTLLTAAGLLWLYSSKDQPTAGAGYTTTAGTSQSTGTGLGERMHHLREDASDKWVATRERVGNTAQSVREKAHRANAGAHNMLEENPLGIGAIAIAAGALIGAMLPSTRRENELMGERREHLTEKARELAQKGRQEAAQVSRDITDRPDDGGYQRSASSGSTMNQGTSPRPS